MIADFTAEKKVYRGFAESFLVKYPFSSPLCSERKPFHHNHHTFNPQNSLDNTTLYFVERDLNIVISDN